VPHLGREEIVNEEEMLSDGDFDEEGKELLALCLIEVLDAVSGQKERIRRLVEVGIIPSEGLNPMVIGATRRLYALQVMTYGSPDRALEGGRAVHGTSVTLQTQLDLAAGLITELGGDSNSFGESASSEPTWGGL